MKQKGLPKSLKHEPLVEAVFEVRLRTSEPLSLADVLPGILFHTFESRPKISRLSSAEIPQLIRANEERFKFVPILRIESDKYFVSVGDQNVIVNCKLPYPKWPNFKKMILKTLSDITKAGITGQVQRYSIKYVNLIPASDFSKQIGKIRMDILLGDTKVDAHPISLRVEHEKDDIIHILSVNTGIKGLVNDNEVFGVLVDVDSIRNVNALDFQTFSPSLQKDIESLKQLNKKIFFNCLKEETIEEMEPEYE